ncbi:TPA: hypothetical protein N0F65_007961, partial [Lagenidium giganteum]
GDFGSPIRTHSQMLGQGKMTPEEGIAVILLLWRRKKRRRLVECVALLRVERPLVPSDRLNLQILNDAD